MLVGLQEPGEERVRKALITEIMRGLQKRLINLISSVLLLTLYLSRVSNPNFRNIYKIPGNSTSLSNFLYSLHLFSFI